jgi:hypothetical protein
MLRKRAQIEVGPLGEASGTTFENEVPKVQYVPARRSKTVCVLEYTEE